MKCDKCEGLMAERSRRIYHYQESGLDNVYLSNIKVFACEFCGVDEPLITRMKHLHAAIARAIALQPYPLSGAETRFLRKQHRRTIEEWSILLRADVSTISRWENGEQQIGWFAEALIRYVYLLLLAEGGDVVKGDVVAQVGSVTRERPKQPALLINADDPLNYSYECEKDLELS